MNKEFYDAPRYVGSHLAKLELPEETIEKIQKWIAKDKNILFFSGNPGLGKSYFSSAYVHFLEENKKTFRYFSEDQFYSKMNEVISNNWDYRQEIKRLCETKYFILDDIGSAQMTPFQKEVLFLFLDERYNWFYPTVITSNYTLTELEKMISKKFVSRLGAKENTVIELNWIDKRADGL